MKAMTVQFASKSMQKVIDKKQQSSLVAIKPVLDACLLFPRSPVLLAELTSLMTKFSSFSEALTSLSNMHQIKKKENKSLYLRKS
jgi:hypothetical protein